MTIQITEDNMTRENQQVNISDCPRTRTVLDEIRRFGYSAADEICTDLCWQLEREAATANAHIAQLREALQQSIAVIKTWHDMDGSNVWDIYYRAAPEMKLIRDCFNAATSPAPSGIPLARCPQ